MKVKNIPFTDDYAICTNQRLIILYHQKMSQQSLKVEMQEICADLSSAQAIDTLGYNLILIRHPTKIDIWVRKQKRN